MAFSRIFIWLWKFENSCNKANYFLTIFQLIYCNICCEPYHDFCLERHERPAGSGPLNWTCPACKFCEVCGDGGASGHEPLQFCAKCRDGYHADCLKKTAYPKRACKRRAGTWVCARCFECAACASRTINYDKRVYARVNATYDFSACLRCYDQLQLDRPVWRCCGRARTVASALKARDSADGALLCDSCAEWTHCACNGLSGADAELVRQARKATPPPPPLAFRFECLSCCGGRVEAIRQRLDELKAGLLAELLGELSAAYPGRVDQREQLLAEVGSAALDLPVAFEQLAQRVLDRLVAFGRNELARARTNICVHNLFAYK